MAEDEAREEYRAYVEGRQHCGKAWPHKEHSWLPDDIPHAFWKERRASQAHDYEWRESRPPDAD